MNPIVPIAVFSKQQENFKSHIMNDVSDQSFFGRGSYVRASMINRSDSFFGATRDGSYSATLFDKKSGSILSKKAKIDTIVRDLLVSILTQRELFRVTSDYEIMEGYRVFEKMLQADSKCHEAMFGLAKLNYKINRFEIAEYWLV